MHCIEVLFQLPVVGLGSVQVGDAGAVSQQLLHLRLRMRREEGGARAKEQGAKRAGQATAWSASPVLNCSTPPWRAQCIAALLAPYAKDCGQQRSLVNQERFFTKHMLPECASRPHTPG